MFIDLPRPAIIGHRGSCQYAPENTLASFLLAVQHQADAIELDAKLCADGTVVVIHDPTVDRTTTGKGVVRKMPLAALKELDAGSHFDIAYRGEKIPTLDEVFALVGHKIPINVELTNYTSMLDDLPERVTALVKKHNLVGKVFFSSFNPVALIRARKQLPQVPICLLATNGSSGAWMRGFPGRLVGYQALHPEKDDVTAKLVNEIHQRGQRINVYTVNSEGDMRRLFDMDVDGIFTDDPPLARKVLTSSKTPSKARR